MMKTATRGMGRAVLGASCILLLAGCDGGYKAAIAPPPSQKQREDLFAKAQQYLQNKLNSEESKFDQVASNAAKAKLDAAMKQAATDLAERKAIDVFVTTGKEVKPDPNPPPAGTVDWVKCYGTMCKGQSTHESSEFFESFAHAAFESPGGSRYPSWAAVTNIVSTGPRRQATFYLGKANAPSR